MRTISMEQGDLDFTIVEGAESVRQRVVQRLRFFRGEWFLNTTAGTPWFSRILTRPVDEGIVDAVLQQEIEGVEGVLRVETLETTIDAQRRALRFTAQVITSEGAIGIDEDITA